MSFVVTGIKMPEDTHEYIDLRIFGDGETFIFDSNNKLHNTLHKSVPLPDRHGRLGDLDALMPDFAKATREFRDGYTFQWILEHAPAIIEAEGSDG